MSRPLQIAVVGGEARGQRAAEAAEEVGRLIAESGARLVCGGRGGVMAAASRGAAGAGGDVIGILPTSSTEDANAHVTHPVATGIGHARNLAVVSTADAVIAIGGSWGTLSEIAFARRLGRRVFALESWAVESPAPIAEGSGVEVAASAEDAVKCALEAAREIRNDV